MIFGIVDGLGEKGRKSWRRFFNGLLKLEPGEVAVITTNRARSGPYHRRHFKIEQTIFESQERFEHFDQYIYWIKVGAGWVTWAAGPSGGVVPIPRSVSYAAADQDDAEATLYASRLMRNDPELAAARGALLAEPRFRFEYTRSDGSAWGVTLAELLARASALEAAYNPNDCPELRWGAAPGSEEARTCGRHAPAEQQAKMQRYRSWFAERKRPARGT